MHTVIRQAILPLECYGMKVDNFSHHLTSPLPGVCVNVPLYCWMMLSNPPSPPPFHPPFFEILDKYFWTMGKGLRNYWKVVIVLCLYILWMYYLCKISLTGRVILDDREVESVAENIEKIITFYCKTRNERYKSQNGWAELLLPFVSLGLPIGEVYNIFYAMHSKYIPR